jgi:hypothetical protein
MSSSPSSVDAPILAGKIMMCIGLVVLGTLLALHLTSFLRFGLKPGSDKFHIKKTLTMATIVVFAFVSLVASAFFLDWRSNPDGCALAGSFISFLYACSKQTQIVFLFQRAKVVHLALNLNGPRIKAMRWAVFLTATLGVSVGFYWMLFVFNFGFVEPTRGVCMFYTTSPAEVIAFAVRFSVYIFFNPLRIFFPLFLCLIRLYSNR